jgi:PAS domain S-box-containing protein
MTDQLYRAIFEAALDALVVVDDEQRFIAANPSACDIFGVSLETLLTRNLLDFIDRGEQPGAQHLWQQFRERDRSQGEIRIRRFDGTFIDVEYRATADISENRHLSVLRPLTERHEARAVQAELLSQLEAHQNRLKGILDSVPGVVWEAWGEPDAACQRIDFVSDYVETMLGYKVEEWLETPNFWLTIVHPEDRDRAASAAAEGFASGAGHIDEFRWMTKDDRAIWVEARAIVIEDKDGKAVGMRGVTIDISARKQAEQALQFSEERFRFLFEQSPMSMQIVEPGGKTVQVNRAWEELWSTTLDRIEGYNLLQDQQLVEKGITPYLLRAFGGEPTLLPEIYYDPQETIAVPDARARWTRAFAYPIQNAGHITEVVLTHEDITDWKQTQRNLQFLLDASGVLTSSLDYEATLTNLAEFAVPSFADYCVVDMFEEQAIRRVALTHRNPAKIALIEELQQRFPQRLDAPVGVARVRRTGEAEMVAEISNELLEASIQNEEQLALARQLNLKSYICVPLLTGEKAVAAISWVRDSSSPSYDAADFELALDLGRRASIAIENALLYRNVTAALASAEAANRAKDEFLAVVSHELRTPLNAISGWASLLSRDCLDASTRAQALEVIERNCYVQSRLVEDILDISTIVGGTLKLERKPIDLASVVKESLPAVNTLAQAKSIELELNLEPSLLIAGDDLRLQQIITNLVSNAIKFTGQNGRVQISLTASGSQAQLRVADNGQGIASDFLPHVFDRFRQADGTSTRRHGGLGLGLAIVRNLVELHGGTVQADSPGAGQGSTFTVELPLLSPISPQGQDTQPLSTLAQETEPFGNLPQKSSQLAGLQVLVVDDEPDAGHLTRLRLESAGANVTTALSTHDALQVLKTKTFSILVSDIAMPEESGYALLQQIRELDDPDKAGILAVALTALATAEAKERVLRAGFQLHLTKPIGSEELIDSIARLCKTSSSGILPKWK